MIDVAAIAEACADETRRRILLLLLAQGELCVCDLFGALELPQPKVSRHLSVLRDANLVVSRKHGTWVHYRLNPDMPLWAVQILGGLADGAARSEPYQSDRERVKSACNGTPCAA